MAENLADVHRRVVSCSQLAPVEVQLPSLEERRVLVKGIDRKGVTTEIADDALSNLYLAFKGTVMVAPAMNEGMWSNLAVQKNIEQLKSRGVQFIDPEEGELACGTTGPGRLANPAISLLTFANHIVFDTCHPCVFGFCLTMC